MHEYKSVGLQHNGSIAQQHTMRPIPKRLSRAAGVDYTGRELMCTVLERCRDGLSQALHDFLCLFRVQRAKAGKCLQSLSVTVSTAKSAANSNYQDLYTEGIEAWMHGSVLPPPPSLSLLNQQNKGNGYRRNEKHSNAIFVVLMLSEGKKKKKTAEKQIKLLI